MEYAFYVYRKDLEGKRSYNKYNHMILKYTFLNLLSLYLHFQILIMIEGKYSVRGVLLILSIIKMYWMEKSEIMSEIQKKSREFVEKPAIDMDLLCKKALVEVQIYLSSGKVMYF